jgi:hypothetical protein
MVSFLNLLIYPVLIIGLYFLAKLVISDSDKIETRSKEYTRKSADLEDKEGNVNFEKILDYFSRNNIKYKRICIKGKLFYESINGETFLAIDFLKN